jgi:hypothetical protein
MGRSKHGQGALTHLDGWLAEILNPTVSSAEERYKLTIAYLNSWLLHVIASIAADRGVYSSTHSIHFGT